jgi:hypothetical protein
LYGIQTSDRCRTAGKAIEDRREEGKTKLDDTGEGRKKRKAVVKVKDSALYRQSVSWWSSAGDA